MGNTDIIYANISPTTSLNKPSTGTPRALRARWTALVSALCASRAYVKNYDESSIETFKYLYLTLDISTDGTLSVRYF